MRLCASALALSLCCGCTAESGPPPSEPTVASPPFAPRTQATGQAPPFNRGAAAHALALAHADARACAASGSGRVTVTFDPDGAVHGVVLESQDLGAAERKCVEAAFGAASV